MRGRGSGTSDAVVVQEFPGNGGEQGKRSAEAEAVGGEQGLGQLRESVWRSLVLCAPSGGT